MIPLAQNTRDLPPCDQGYTDPQLLKDPEDAEDSFYSAIV